MVLTLDKNMLFQKTGLEQDTGLLAERWGQDGSAAKTLNGGTSTLYTVTAGKTFYATSFVVSSYNIENIETISLMDGATEKFSFQYPASALAQTFTFNFSTPIPFVTDVDVDVTGDNFTNNTVIGWEE
jgi:hypothetical protein